MISLILGSGFNKMCAFVLSPWDHSCSSVNCYNQCCVNLKGPTNIAIIVPVREIGAIINVNGMAVVKICAHKSSWLVCTAYQFEVATDNSYNLYNVSCFPLCSNSEES